MSGEHRWKPGYLHTIALLSICALLLLTLVACGSDEPAERPARVDRHPTATETYYCGADTDAHATTYTTVHYSARW